MEIEKDLIQIIIEILLLFLALYLAFFKSYFQEKGKNIATKEDIGEITEEIESIKNGIQFYTQSKLTLKNEERNALIELHEKYSYWLKYAMGLELASINEDNKSKLDTIEDKLSKANLEFEIAVGKMEIFVASDELSKIVGKLTTETLMLHSLAVETINKKGIFLLEVSIMKLKTPPEKCVEVLRKMSQDHVKKREEFNANKLKKYREILPFYKEMQGVIFKEIQAIIGYEYWSPEKKY